MKKIYRIFVKTFQTRSSRHRHSSKTSSSPPQTRDTETGNDRRQSRLNILRKNIFRKKHNHSKSK